MAFCVILCCLLMIFPSAIMAISCALCEGGDCIDLSLPLVECDEGVNGCVSILTEGWTDQSRFSIRRDCYTDEHKATCTIERLANQTCRYCDDEDGCNMRQRDPIICKQCYFTKGVNGLTCETSAICYPIFRTVAPQCQVSWAGQYEGSYYGCWHQMDRRARRRQEVFDPAKIQRMQCDGNDCNSGLKVLFDNVTSLLDQQRFCYEGRSDKKFLMPCQVYSDRERHIPFCYYSSAPHSKSSMYNHDCFGKFHQYPDSIRYLLIDNQASYVCNSNGCNRQAKAPLYACYGFNRTQVFVYRNTDSCVIYKDPDGEWWPLGRMHMNYCSDLERCFICRSHLCNTQENAESRRRCYHANGEEGFYIGQQQVHGLDMCPRGVSSCMTIFRPNYVWRGCYNSSAPSDAQTCDSDACNNQPATNYCFICSISDPNCVFSQGGRRPFKQCPFDHLGCYVRVFGDGSAERGCSKGTPPEILDTEVIYCEDRILCNSMTTKIHSCHLYHAEVLRLPELPSFVLRKWDTSQGFLFETCADELGLPACYTRTYTKDHIMYHKSGCTNEITAASFLHYHRMYRDMETDGTILCDGHYCNTLPMNGPAWIRVDEPLVSLINH